MLSRRQKFLIFFSSLLVALVLFLQWLPPQLRSAESMPEEISVYELMEHRLLHEKLQLPPTPRPSNQIVMVSFDWQATKIYGPLPWPRDVFANLLQKLRRLGAKTIVMDPLFSDAQLGFIAPATFKSLYPALPLEQIPIVNPFNYLGELRNKLARAEHELSLRAPEDPAAAAQLVPFAEQRHRLLTLVEHIVAGDANLAFETTVAQQKNIIFPTDYSNIPTFTKSSGEALRLWEKHALAPFPGAERIKGYEHILTLYPRLLATGALVGVNEVDKKQYPFINLARVLVRQKDRVWASSMVHALSHFLGAPLRLTHLPAGDLQLTIGSHTLEIYPTGAFPLAYYNDRSFPPQLSAIDLLRDRIPASAVKDKLVIVDIRNEQAETFLRVATPIFGQHWVSDVKATLASNILQGHRGPPINRPSWLILLEGMSIWLLAGLFVLLTTRVSLWRSLGIGVLLLATIAVVDLLVLVPHRLWFQWGILALEIPLLMVICVIAHYLIQRAARQKVRRAFGFYLPKNVLQHMIHSENALKLGGERRNLSVLFSDIRGFTTLSERADPDALGQALNLHLTTLTQAVFDQQGTLDKYMGDCVMAFFGAPLEMTDHALRAVRAALEMQRGLDRIQNTWREKAGDSVSIGVGVASGDVIVGNMGSETLFDYTVIGDTANLASRLEGLTKVYGVEVLVSEETRQQCSEGLTFLEVDLVQVKGKDLPVRIYEVVCEGAPEAARLQYNDKCTAGIAAYRLQQWDEALKHFDRALELLPTARLPILYHERIASLRDQELPHDWAGITRFDHK